MAEHEEQEGGQEHVGPLDKYLRHRKFDPSAKRSVQEVPQAAFRSINVCQQFIAQELGWPSQRPLNTWRKAQAQSTLIELQLPPVWDTPPNAQRRQGVCSLQVQPPPEGAGAAGSCRGDSSGLVAVGYSSGIVHLVKVAELIDTAATAAGSWDSAHTSHSPTGESVPVSACVPRGNVWTVDLQDRLLSCCWSHNSVPELATAGALGVKIRRFVEGRHHEYPLTLKGGAQLAKADQVKYLDQGAAYTLAANKPGGLVLWDCRAASKAVTELPTSNMPQLLQPLPGGTVLLTAAADGWVALHDVRKVSCNTSVVVNFGSSRASQQLIASFNVPARADEAVVAGGASSSSAPRRTFPYFSDVQVNPADCNLIAYMRPDLQVGVLDLFSNRVLQQVCLTESVGSYESYATVAHQSKAPARCCWDSSGRVLYSQGFLMHADSSASTLQPTLAAVDFGSWAGSQTRRSSCWSSTPRNTSSTGSSSSSTATSDATEVQHPQAVADGGAAADFAAKFSSCAGSAWRGVGLVCRHGQVLHLPVPYTAIPNDFAVAGGNGELWMGTSRGDVLSVQ